MSWRDQLRPASFRGAGFLVEDHSLEAGRRLVGHIYPQRDLPYVEDLGRRPRRYSLSAFVLGEDYMAARDALVAACEREGPGLLIHPYLGEAKVLALRCDLREADQEGRMAHFFLTFEEAGARRFPAARPDSRAQVDQAGEAAGAAAVEDFAESFQTAGQPQSVADAAIAQVEDYLEAAGDLLRRAAEPVDRVGDFARQVLNLRAELDILVAQPVAIAERLRTAVVVFRASVEEPAEILDPLERLADYGDDLPDVPLATPPRKVEAANQAALTLLLRRAAVVELARAASLAGFDSADRVIALRDLTVARLDGEILAAGDTGDDASFRSLRGLMAALVEDLNARALQLPRLQTIRLPRTEPALVTAYRLYGDAGRAEEIVVRNSIAHPGFLPGGVPLLVLER